MFLVYEQDGGEYGILDFEPQMRIAASLQLAFRAIWPMFMGSMVDVTYSLRNRISTSSHQCLHDAAKLLRMIDHGNASSFQRPVLVLCRRFSGRRESTCMSVDSVVSCMLATDESCNRPGDSVSCDQTCISEQHKTSLTLDSSLSSCSPGSTLQPVPPHSRLLLRSTRFPLCRGHSRTSSAPRQSSYPRQCRRPLRYTDSARLRLESENQPLHSSGFQIWQ